MATAEWAIVEGKGDPFRSHHWAVGIQAVVGNRPSMSKFAIVISQFPHAEGRWGGLGVTHLSKAATPDRIFPGEAWSFGADAERRSVYASPPS